MANKYFRGVGGSISLASNWSLSDGGPADAGTVPAAADNAFFTANSGDAVVNTNMSLLTISFNGYAKTLSGTFTLTIGGAAPTVDITLSPLMTITYTGILSVNGFTTNLTSNGKTWTGTLQVNGSGKTYNFLDNWTVQNFTSASGTTFLMGAVTITVLGNYSTTGNGASTLTGIILAGTGTISGVGASGVPITIDTTGTITFSGNVVIGRSLTYIRGTLITTGSTLVAYGLSNYSSQVIFDLRGSTWNSIGLGNGTTSALTTFISGFTCSNFIHNTSSPNQTLASFTPGFLYRITTALTGILTDGNAPQNKKIQSTVPGTMATLTLDAGATCNIGFYTFTDIDASGGRTIWVFGGIVSNCINVNPYNDPIITSAKSFVS